MGEWHTMKKLLWIDDDETLIDSSTPVFLENGFYIFKATNTSRALKILREEVIDGILLDVKLHGDENGLELLEEIICRYSTLPIAVFTGYPEFDDHVHAERLGASIYLEKIEKSIPLEPVKQCKFFYALHQIFSGVSIPVKSIRPYITNTVEIEPGDANHVKIIKILFLCANPINTVRLRLDQEVRSIDEALRQADLRDKFDIKQHWAVRVKDLQNCLLRYSPDIVHFSGHGSTKSEIVLEDGNGNSHSVSIRALSKLFSVLRMNIRCVILDACYSEAQAKTIAQYIDCTVGMSKAITDSAAISFSLAFYQALGYGKDIKTAFDLGCVQIDLENLEEQDIPQLIALNIEPEKLFFV
jgi:CheY-like chemotaxis protein